ncbi:MAG TPA: zinc ribbon domain-containing protein [Thermoplasmata archaeon]|nr:zinc ribbon domain-containing protein [Thermoplasmata archaeon]
MNARPLAPAAVLLLAALALVGTPTGSAAAPATGGHYLPHVDDSFAYYETIVLDHGTGNYTGYTEHQWINGSEEVTVVGGSGTDEAAYNYTGLWVNNQGAPPETFYAPTIADYNFSATTYRYLAYTSGTDGQYGYTNPYVWYYANNSLGVGGRFDLLNTEFNVTNLNASYPVAPSLSSTGYAKTIEGVGTGSFGRDDSYGVFTARYTWTVNLDPGTGYIVGYLYTEHDTDGSGDGFTWTDALTVTHTTYALTPDSAPPAASAPAAGPPVLLIVIVVVVVLLIVIAVALALRGRRRPSLPQHSSGGTPQYSPGPLGPPPPAVSLTPAGEPPVQQIVMKETVKVNCRYCGTLISATDTVCPNCGAPRT